MIKVQFLLYLLKSFPQEQVAADLLLLMRKQQQCISNIYNKGEALVLLSSLEYTKQKLFHCVFQVCGHLAEFQSS